jgi:hypothetical protein
MPVAARRIPRYPAGTVYLEENRMRRLMGVVSAISLLSAQPVLAVQQCSSASDQSAFEVQALRSELMVLATGCNDDTQYNAFINRFKPDLQANERAIAAYFSHHYGRSAQTEHDHFVTELANAMSRQGSDMGGDFCARNGLIFDEVMSLPATTDLSDFVAGKQLVPASVEICTPATSGSSKGATSVASKKHK